ncbi:protein strawberry notch homolog 1 [Caerostris extrusa]|uniref:Protein strawberry notch homolog 1 n=1 Tax=Caerostris extrusa TaxID=172846 RepID=A0AAV4Y2S9_CAEEX|nr:protein strawberry notch homolog 1 [Caerostris extrusa]
MDKPKRESPDLLSAALDESGITPENDPAALHDKDFIRQFQPTTTPKASQGENFMHMQPNAWNPANFNALNAAMMDYSRFPLMDKNFAGMMSPEMFNPAIMQMALQSQMMNGFPGYPYNFGPKDLNQYYMNGDAVYRSMAAVEQRAEAEEGEEDEEELLRAETYADYMPSKLRIGIRHPDSVIETSSLSSVQPPDVWYKLSIPEEVIDRGSLSALQLESITYASQQHETILPDGSRAGFLIGDGAGVGKGRTLAGIIFENYLLGLKRAIWLSVSNDLKYDAERDLKDIGAAKIEVHALNKFKYAKISSKVNGSVKKGVIFATYSSLIGESQSGGKYKTRLKQLLHWCGDDFDGCIVFDECHKAKNLCPAGSSKPTKTGLTVLELQNKLPKARIVYASATGASEPKNMAYMTRLGLWGSGTSFPEFTNFISVVEKRGVGAMELVAMDMKLRGLYMARQLSFTGVSFKIEEIPLTEEDKHIYNQSVRVWVISRSYFQEAFELMEGDSRTKKTMWCQFWASHQRFFKYLCIAAKVKFVVKLAREAVKNGKCVVIGLQSTGEARTLEQLEECGGELNDFVSTAKGVFLSLIEKQFPAPDHKKTLRLLGLDSKSGIGSPGASTSSGGKHKPLRRARQDDESPAVENDDASPSGSDSRESDFNPFEDESDSDGPWTSRKKNKKDKGKKRKNKSNHGFKKQKTPPKPPPNMDAISRCDAMKAELIEMVEDLGKSLPPNTLDHLIDELGGPENVAEMTGRKGRIVSNDGNIQYESRSEADAPMETLNMIEKQRFMDGEKRIAIISEAASSGISLQSDRRCKNQARRVHMTLELPWSADKAVQQFGRTHRSNQVNAPEYIFLISNLAGERRFASIVAKRLESLGALTHGDRRATESRDLSQFNIDTKYGRTALESTMHAIMNYGGMSPLVPPPAEYKGNFFVDVRQALTGVGLVVDEPSGYQSLDKDYNNMSKFMNRILGLPVELQNSLFQYFTDTLDAVITQAKKAGRYDLGILDLGSGGDLVKRVKLNTFLQKHATGVAKTELHTVLVERGLSWEGASEKFDDCNDKDEGFYLSAQARNSRKTAILAVADTGKSKSDKGKLFRVYRPNTGLQAKQETLDELKSKYRKSTKKDVEEHWKENYDKSETLCSHMYWYGQCRRKTVHGSCEVGLRQRKYYVLSGSVLSVWTKIESIMSAHQGSHKLQVVRLKFEESSRVVGCLIPGNLVDILKKVLAEEAADTDEQEF